MQWLILSCILIITHEALCCSSYLQDPEAVSKAIKLQIKENKGKLNYPNSVERFYNSKRNQLIWVLPDSIDRKGWKALLLLDCVAQFGLNHNDYHPEKLLSVEMHQLKTNAANTSISGKAIFDVLLTDAIMTLMKNLHYGKLNAKYTQKIIDNSDFRGFTLYDALSKVLLEKDFMSAVLEAQPHFRPYQLLQERLRLITGQYVGDCYEVPEGEVKKIGINLERLRWLNSDNESYLLINIPSGKLIFQLADTSYQFRVIVGKSSNPIPILESVVTHLTFAGDDNTLGKIIFRFKNLYGILLDGALNENLSSEKQRALNHKCIRVGNALKLAQLILINDRKTINADLNRQLKGKLTPHIKLRKPLRIFISYLTCAEVNGVLEYYDDIYNLDQKLEEILYYN